MDEIWKIALGITGLAGVASLLIYSLYSQWLKLPIFAKLDKELTYSILKIFLFLTFAFAAAALVSYVYIKANDHPGNEAVAEVTNFTAYQNAYRTKYENLDSVLDEQIMQPLLPLLIKFDFAQFSEAVIQLVNKTNNQKNIIQVAEFYESILKCEKQRDPGCTTERINEYFGQPMHNFWYSFRPYISHLRGNGYPHLARLLENRAREIHQADSRR